MISFIKLQSKANPSSQTYIFSRYKNTLEKGFYLKDSVDSNEAITSHFYHFASFLADLQDKFTISLDECNAENFAPQTYAKLVFLDPPSFKVSLKIIEKFKKENVILLISENPMFLKDACLCKIYPRSSTVISSIPLGIDNLVLSQSSFVYKTIPKYLCTPIQKSKKLTTLIYSNLFISASSNYPFRIKLINLLTEVYGENFSFYGRSWDLLSSFKNQLHNVREHRRKYFKLLVKVIFRFLGLKIFYPQINLDSYKGECSSKIILSNYKSFISVENSCLVPGFFTEKPFEPLIYDCLPVILTDNSLIPPLFDDIPRYPKNDILGLFLFLSRINADPVFAEETTLKIKSRINKYLEHNYAEITSLGILKSVIIKTY